MLLHFVQGQTLIGYEAGTRVTDRCNTFIGASAGDYATDAKYNVAIGQLAGGGSIFSPVVYNTGDYNVFVGSKAGFKNGAGGNNVYLGFMAGFEKTGSNNVFIGHQAGYQETGSDKLYIENSDATSTGALIYGEFDGDGKLRFNANVGIENSSPDTKLHILGGLDASLLSGSGYFVLGSITGANIVMDENEIIARNNGSTTILYLNREGGEIQTMATFSPQTHKGADLGKAAQAWDNLYYDDAYNQGAAAFYDRNVSDEIIHYPPKPKTPGMFDYKTDRGLEELDPASLPVDLTDGKMYILTDEMTTYNYKANYEQQVTINLLIKSVEVLQEAVKEQKNIIETQENEILILKANQSELDKLKVMIKDIQMKLEQE